MSQLFSIGGSLPKRTVLMIEIGTVVLILLLWFLLTMPRESRSINFVSSHPSETQYSWTGKNSYKADFSGDNYIGKLTPGTYIFTAQLESGAEVSDSVVIPANLKEKTDLVFEKDSLKVTLTLALESDGFIGKGVLPTPLSVLGAFRDLHFDSKGKVKDNSFVFETGYSLSLNILGYIEAIIFSLLIGFLIGLVQFFRASMSRGMNAIRFIPLSAVTGIFIAWFGIEANMKVQFLAFGIFVYLMPVVVQRIDELEKVYLQTAYTLGATKWQQIRSVYFPAVASRLIDDIRVLTAISWTYIILAELLNQKGGIGGLIHLAQRQSRLDQVFALLFVIVIIGIVQDRLFVWLDRKLFKFKYQSAI